MKEKLSEYIAHIFLQLTEIEATWILYVMLVMTSFIVINEVLRALKRTHEESGLDVSQHRKIQIDGAKGNKAKTYISEVQGISGRPDAVILERGFFIPVERKPLGNKVRDRHIAQLLVYMRLIEEFEGKKPPYGYLILGKKSRKVKIYNTDERQKWLTSQLRLMRNAVEKEKFAPAQPHPKKCDKCQVRDRCSEKAELHKPNAPES
ncbi:Dna2/Cas4 domain-containing protein [bacterium]|nr:Dna2/Cas4 domain-containing protein [bacterium]